MTSFSSSQDSSIGIVDSSNKNIGAILEYWNIIMNGGPNTICELSISFSLNLRSKICNTFTLPLPISPMEGTQPICIHLSKVLTRWDTSEEIRFTSFLSDIKNTIEFTITSIDNSDGEISHPSDFMLYIKYII